MKTTVQAVAEIGGVISTAVALGIVILKAFNVPIELNWSSLVIIVLSATWLILGLFKQ